MHLIVLPYLGYFRCTRGIHSLFQIPLRQAYQLTGKAVTGYRYRQNRQFKAESEIVRLVSLSTTDITEITRLKKKTILWV